MFRLRQAFKSTASLFLLIWFLVTCCLGVSLPQLFYKDRRYNRWRQSLTVRSGSPHGGIIFFSSKPSTHTRTGYSVRGCYSPLLIACARCSGAPSLRRTFLLTYIAPTEADSRKAATLELSHLLITTSYVQMRLEGYLPAKPAAKGRQSHVNTYFSKLFPIGRIFDECINACSTTWRPQGSRPNEGLIWGNMAITAEHVESMVASLCAQGLLHGYLAHSQGRFAIMGAKQKGSAVAAGWPSVYEVLTRTDDEIPGGLETSETRPSHSTTR